MTERTAEIGKLAAAVAVCQAAGLIGSLFAAPAIPTWYATLTKPNWAPPDWVFVPIWILLCAMMGISLYFIWRARTKENCHCTTLQLFFFQLFVAVLWIYLFFGMQEPLIAFFGALFLILIGVVAIVHFWTISKIAAYLLMPYAMWVVFVAVLNYSLL